MIISSLGLISYNNTNNNQSNFPVNSVYVIDDSEVSFSWSVYIYSNNINNNNIDNKNIINNFNKNQNSNINNNNNIKLIKQNLNIIYKNKLNNNETIIYSNNNLTLIENNVFYNNSAISSSIYLISKINANYIVTFNVISINNNKSNYSACEIVNNNTEATDPFTISGNQFNNGNYPPLTGKNIFITDAEGHIEIPCNELNEGFTIGVNYHDIYSNGCTNGTECKTASTTQTITATPASAIYGSVLYSNLSTDKINVPLYLENVNTHTFYNVSIKDGRFLFFAQPDTEYKVYYNNNGNFNQIYTINASNLTAGNGFYLRLPSSSV